MNPQTLTTTGFGGVGLYHETCQLWMVTLGVDIVNRWGVNDTISSCWGVVSLILWQNPHGDSVMAVLIHQARYRQL